MTRQLKRLHSEAIPKALERAERYRLLNEPLQADSICRDVLEIDPNNQTAFVTLLLALTDQFLDPWAARAASEAHALVPRLSDPYGQAYYAGIISERSGLAEIRRRQAGSGAYESLREAMVWYEKAEGLRPAGNDDAILRWNACARTIERSALQPPLESGFDPLD